MPQTVIINVTSKGDQADNIKVGYRADDDTEIFELVDPTDAGDRAGAKTEMFGLVNSVTLSSRYAPLAETLNSIVVGKLPARILRCSHDWSTHGSNGCHARLFCKTCGLRAMTKDKVVTWDIADLKARQTSK
jgi:hypothetical protein